MSTAALVIYSPPEPPARRDGVIVIGSTWWNGLLVAASLAAALVFAVRAAVGSRDRATCWAHAFMGLAMAGMLWPSGDPTPAPAGVVVFAVIGSWFAAGWLRSGSRRVDAVAHVVVGSVAMVLMYLTHSGAAHATVPGTPGGHAGHAAAAAAGGGPGALLGAAGLLLAGYFVWHAWESLPHMRVPALAGAVGPEPAGAQQPVAAVPAGSARHLGPRVEPAAHVVMSLLMAVMFLGIV